MPLPIIAGALASTAMGIGAGAINDSRQLGMQGQLTEMQLKNQMKLNQDNARLNYDMWKKTNYKAQTDELVKAGLNPGLLYGMGGGAGGATAQTAGASSAGTAGIAQRSGGAEGMGIQAAMMKAQIDNIKADTREKNVNADKTEGVDTELGHTQIESIKQGITNRKTANELMGIQDSLS